MDYIIEPEGVDFVVAPGTLTDDDIRSIRSAIADYRKTGMTNVPVTIGAAEKAEPIIKTKKHILHTRKSGVNK